MRSSVRWLVDVAVVAAGALVAVWMWASSDPPRRDDVAGSPAVAPTPPKPEPAAKAPMEGFRWLLDRQEPSGRWRDPATTGIVMMTFLGAGWTAQSGGHREEMKRALVALRDGADADGCLAGAGSPRRLRDHAIAGLALTEAYGMTGSRAWKTAAERAVAFGLASRSPGGAWNLPAPDDGVVDLETTMWMTMLLKSASIAELHVDGAVFGEVASAIDPLVDPGSGRFVGPARVRAGLSEDAATAAVLLVRVLAAKGRRADDDVSVARTADALLARPPAADTADLPHMYFGSLGMLWIGGARFRAWLPTLTAFVERQPRADGPDAGSWDPPSGDADPERARLSSTAYHRLCMNFYFGPVAHAAARR